MVKIYTLKRAKSALALILVLTATLAFAESDPKKLDLITNNLIYRSLISQMLANDKLEDIDWFCPMETEDDMKRCDKKANKIAKKNMFRLYRAMERSSINCLDDLEGIQSKLEDYEGMGLSEIEVNSVGDHRNFTFTNNFFKHINNVANPKSGRYIRTSMTLEGMFIRNGKSAVTCKAVATVTAKGYESVNQAMQEGTACDHYEKMAICLKGFAQTSQDIYGNKIRYKEEKGFQLNDLTEPLWFMKHLRVQK